MTKGCRECEWAARFTGVEKECGRCARDAAAKAREIRDLQHQQWYRETGHCGYCGDPGVFCICTDTDPCGCRDLHEMGSARLPDALEAFMPTIIHVDQGDLFGDAS